ncbi:MAG: 4-alpha-glucanotransferase [Pyrinomonadaceae bacterium]
MKFPRASGILLHITSLPSPFGIGDLGPKAYEFIDFLVRAKQRYWQILSIGQTGYGNSPYSCYSAFAGNIYLISPQALVADGLLPESAAAEWHNSMYERVDYDRAIRFKLQLLRRSFEAFRETTDEVLIGEFHNFCEANGFWLEDYTLYRAISLANDHAHWTKWGDKLKHREPEALAAKRNELDDDVFAEKFYQFIFFRQWNTLKKYANENDVIIIGDIPIYVTDDSCDVWCNQDQFKLDENGKPAVVAGVPPDAFSRTGQLWGSPIYDWARMRDDGFRWWTDRVRFNLAMFDLVRIDHFIGLTRAWEVPAGDKTAVNGQWIPVPGRDLLLTLQYALGSLAVIAEDLGEVTPAVEDLRDSFGIPGMRILQFAFGSDSKNPHMPHNYIQNSVVYTGTHDNETVVGWYKARKKQKRAQPLDITLEHCLNYLKSDGRNINWDFISAAIASVADIAIMPMQDILGLDNRSRMNTPATTKDNWSWRYKDSDLAEATASRLAELNKLYGR